MDSWPNRAQRYRREAERLRAEAGKADPYTREQLLNVARQYERLATSIWWDKRYFGELRSLPKLGSRLTASIGNKWQS